MKTGLTSSVYILIVLILDPCRKNGSLGLTNGIGRGGQPSRSLVEIQDNFGEIVGPKHLEFREI